MTRLNNNIRDKILSNALGQAGVFKREATLKTRRADLAESCRLYAMGGVENEKKLIKVVEKRKKLLADLDFKYGIHAAMSSTVYKDYDINVAFGGMQIRLYFSGDVENTYIENDRVYKSPAPKDRVLFAADHEFSTEFSAIEKEAETVKSLRETVTANVKAVLQSVTTVKKLLEVWPESKELIPTNVDSPSINLPSVNVEQLNTMIGIPTE